MILHLPKNKQTNITKDRRYNWPDNGTNVRNAICPPIISTEIFFTIDELNALEGAIYIYIYIIFLNISN